MSSRVALVTDTACDLPRRVLEEHRIEALGFPFVIDGVEHIDDLGATMSFDRFYDELRSGHVSRTTQVPIPSFADCFERNARAGIPTVYLGFSSALSGTFETACRIAESVSARYPEAPVTVVDTKSASIAQGVLVLEAVRTRDTGASAEEIASAVAALVPAANGFFTLESLEYLARGGRIPDALAKAGAMLDVRPVLQFSQEGSLAAGMPQRGRRRSLKALVAKVSERAALSGGARVLVGHAQSEEDAAFVRDGLLGVEGVTEVLCCDIGPVIGSHVGPGMVAVAFIGTPRGL